MNPADEILEFVQNRIDHAHLRYRFSSEAGNTVRQSVRFELEDIKRFIIELKKRRTGRLVFGVRNMARECGVSQKWFGEQLKLGWIPYIQAGNRYVFNGDRVIDALLERAGKVGNERDG